MATLYELTNSYLEVLELAEQLDAEALKDTLDSIDEVIELKAENTAKVIEELKGKLLVTTKEIQRLTERKRTIKNNIDGIKTYLQNEMEKVGKTKIKGDLFNINIQNNPPSLRVNHMDKIPKNFFIEQEPTLDKEKLKKAIKGGEEIDGVELVQTRGVRIR